MRSELLRIARHGLARLLVGSPITVGHHSDLLWALLAELTYLRRSGLRVLEQVPDEALDLQHAQDRWQRSSRGHLCHTHTTELPGANPWKDFGLKGIERDLIE